MLQRLLDEAQDPWDWAAGGIGAIFGLAITASVGGLDGGTGTAGGFVAAVTASKAFKAALRGRKQGKRIQGLEKLIRGITDDIEKEGLLARIKDVKHLWQNKVIEIEQVAGLLDGLAEDYRKVDKDLKG